MKQRGQSKDLKNGVLLLKTKILANESYPSMQVALKFGSGSFQFSEPAQFQYMADRGQLDDVRNGDDQPVDFSFEGKFTFGFSRNGDTQNQGLENFTVHEYVKGKYRGNTSNFGKPRFAGTRESWLANYGCPPYCFDLEYHDNPKLLCPDSTAYGEALLFRYCRAEQVQANIQTGMISVSGKAHILAPISQRVIFNYTTDENASQLTNWVADPRAV